MKYAAIMFDVIESRRYFDRYEVQNIIINSVEYLNRIYSYAIKKNVVSSAGDEFQGLFLNLQDAFLYIRKLQFIIYPIKIRCGVGYGEIKYDVEEWSSSATDGEAYYLARDAITFTDKKKNNFFCFNTNTKYDKYLNSFCASTMQIKHRQSQIVYLIELIADILLPIIPCKEEKLFYEFLLENRHRLIAQEEWNKISKRYRDEKILKINLNYLFDNRYDLTIKEKKKDDFFPKEFWMRGMSTKIAEIMNTTRQNIDRYISLGKVKESRTMDKTIYELLGEKIW
ncbi:MAG: SatD family protein [Lachnospiraceae bacterium]|nr:SatD family protein [Lachnospiraceae bacterium]